jgi:hypothetical protein
VLHALGVEDRLMGTHKQHGAAYTAYLPTHSSVHLSGSYATSQIPIAPLFTSNRSDEDAGLAHISGRFDYGFVLQHYGTPTSGGQADLAVQVHC